MRVSIARALATNPRLLLMDEPFAALDEMSRDRLNEELLRLRAEQKWTAVFVTHSVAEAVFLSTRIVVLAPNPGRICAELPVDLPWPRTAALRETPEFEALVAKVSHALARSDVAMKRRLIVAANALGVFAALLLVVATDYLDVSRAAIHAALAVGGGESGGGAFPVVAEVLRDHRGRGRRRADSQHRRGRRRSR